VPVLLDMAISLDGHIGRDDGSDLGLYDWYFEPSDISKPVVDELVEMTGAIVLGRGAFGRGDDVGGGMTRLTR
jgi:riboflavin biosynthesis pyrimidine reductase